jgi:putative membrane protein
MARSLPVTTALLVTSGLGMAGDVPLRAHESIVHAASSAWSIDTFAAPGLIVALTVYATGVTRLWRRGGTSAIARWQAVAFGAGWLAAAAVLISPLDWIADVLFSVHMTQHAVLMLLAAPLIMLGDPAVAALWSLPLRARWFMAAAIRRVAWAGRWRIGPVAVFCIQAVVLLGWHVPMLFNAALAHPGLHAFQHLTMFGSASLFWWTMVRGRYGRSAYGASVVYVFATALYTGGLGAVLTFSPAVWYVPYVRSAMPFGVNALVDQQLAGLLMWIPSALVFIAFGLGLFAAWLGDGERRARLVAARRMPS